MKKLKPEFIDLTSTYGRRRYFIMYLIVVFLLNWWKIAVHELSHTFIILSLGGAIDGITILPFRGFTLWAIDSIPESDLGLVYAAGLIGELFFFYSIGVVLFLTSRFPRGMRMIGYWIIVLSMTTALYWVVCPFSCPQGFAGITFDPLGLAKSLGIQRDFLGWLAFLPFILVCLCIFFASRHVILHFLKDPKHFHLICLLAFYLTLMLTSRTQA